jgi:23S rRNA (guanosine2251-2'-O)-methyltransferase
VSDEGGRGERRSAGESGRSHAQVVAGRRAVAEAIRGGRVTEVLIVSSPTVTQGMRAVLEEAEDRAVPVRTVPRATLDALADEHRGVVARLGAAAQDTLSERDLATFPFVADAVVVVLDGIVDPQNLGAAARSAEAAGAAMLVTRTRRAAEVTAAAVRASAGALVHLPHARVANIARAVERLQGAGFWVVGLDERSEVSVYDEACPEGRVAVVIGGEGEGMSRLTRERCDRLVRLPMRGRVGSLNAAASLAAVLYAYVVPTRN